MLRDFAPADAGPLGKVALESFEQFRSSYSDWTAMADRVSHMSELSKTGELILAEDHGQIVGGVAYAYDGPRTIEIVGLRLIRPDKCSSSNLRPVARAAVSC